MTNATLDPDVESLVEEILAPWRGATPHGQPVTDGLDADVVARLLKLKPGYTLRDEVRLCLATDINRLLADEQRKWEALTKYITAEQQNLNEAFLKSLATSARGKDAIKEAKETVKEIQDGL